jgi:hypothetical protein
MTELSRGRVIFFRSAIVAATLLGLLAIGEAAVRVVSAWKPVYDLEMFKYAVQLKQPDPLGELSHVHRPNHSARLMGVDIALNSLGQRGPEPDLASRPGRKKVLVVGGSIAMGWGVPFDQVFTSLAERELNQKSKRYTYSFFNLGVGNFSLLSRYGLFKRQYPLIKPDLVVLHYYVGDIEDRPPPRNCFILRHSYLANFVLYRVLLYLSTRDHDLLSHVEELYAPASPRWKNGLAYIRQMKEFLAADRVPLVILTTPEIHNLQAGNGFERIYAEIRKEFDELKIPTLDAYKDFQKCCAVENTKIWVAPGDWHPNAVGHEIMADQVVSYILQNEAQLWKW